MPLDTSASEVDTVFSCVSIFQLISSLPTYPPREHNLTYTYPYLFHSRCYSLYVSYFSCWVRRMPLDTSASEVDTVFSCVSIFQLISSLPTYPPREHNLTYTYPYLFHSRCYSLYVSYFSCWVRCMPLDTSASEVDTVFSCVSIFQLISSLPTYPPREHNLTYTYPYLFHSRCYSLYVSYFLSWVQRMPLDTSASEVDTVFSCVSIFQLISSLPTYPPREHNLTYTYLHLFHSRCFHKRTYFYWTD